MLLAPKLAGVFVMPEKLKVELEGLLELRDGILDGPPEAPYVSRLHHRINDSDIFLVLAPFENKLVKLEIKEM